MAPRSDGEAHAAPTQPVSVMSSYSQFLYGKRPDVPGYRVVACTPDLAGRIDELEALVRRYRLWGTQPPVARPVAVGVVPGTSDALLISATSSSMGAAPAYDTSGRLFVWYRFVFVPTSELDARGGRIWQFLEWLRELPPPVAPAHQTALAPLRPPPVVTAPERAAEVELVRRCLAVRDGEGRSTLLAALGDLVTGSRLVLDERAHPSGVSPQEMAKALLLLLPAPYRSAIGLAVGDIDEQACQWPGLLLRRAGPPLSLPPESVWLKLSTAQLHGDGARRTSRSYADLVTAILDDDQLLPGLLARLEVLAPPAANVTRPGPVAAIPLLTLLPERGRQEALWPSLAAQIDLGAWSGVLPELDAPLRALLWNELLARAVRGRAEVIPLLAQLARGVGRDEREALLEHERAAHPAVGERLLLHELLLAPELQTERGLAAFATRVVVAHRADLRRARSIAHCALESPLFPGAEERFRLLDAVAAALTHADELRALVAGELSALLFAVPPAAALGGHTQATAQRLLAPLAGQLERALSADRVQPEELAGLADTTAMTLDQRATFYAAVAAGRQLAAPQTHWLIADVLGESRHAAGASAWSWRAALRAWDGALDLLGPQLRALLDATEGSTHWGLWQRVAEALLNDELQRVRFLDRALDGGPLQQQLAAWLRVIAVDRAAVAVFLTSAVRRRLDEGPVWIRQGVSVLIGLAPLSAGVPRLLLRLQSELELESPMLLSILDGLAADEGPGGDGGVAAAQASVELQLRLGVREGQRGDAAIRRLQATSPSLAELALTLLAGRADERTLARLISTLADKPELLGRWLAAAGCARHVRGQLLRSLVALWLREPPAEDEEWLLRELLARPEQLPSDRVALLELCWLPGREWGTLAHGGPLPVESWPHLVVVACAAVGRCVRREQAARIIDDCVRLGLPLADRLTVLRATEPALRSVAQIQAHLFSHGADGVERLESTAMEMLLQVKPDDEERERLHLALTLALAHELRRPDTAVALRIAYWRSCAFSPEIWRRASETALKGLVETHLSPLLERARQLEVQGLSAESTMIYDAFHLHLRLSVLGSGTGPTPA